jgi:hypothetical protein
MKPAAVERVLRNLGRFVKRGGHLFVSRIDLDIRTKVVLEMNWKPVAELMEQIHEGDPSIGRWCTGRRNRSRPDDMMP